MCLWKEHRFQHFEFCSKKTFPVEPQNLGWNPADSASIFNKVSS